MRCDGGSEVEVAASTAAIFSYALERTVVRVPGSHPSRPRVGWRLVARYRHTHMITTRHILERQTGRLFYPTRSSAIWGYTEDLQRSAVLLDFGPSKKAVNFNTDSIFSLTGQEERTRGVNQGPVDVTLLTLA